MWTLTCGFLVAGTATAVVLGLFPLWGVRAGFGESQVALALALVSVAALLAHLAVGWLADRLRPERVLFGVSTGLMVACGIVAVGPGVRSTELVFACLAVTATFSVTVYPLIVGVAQQQGCSGKGPWLALYGVGAFAGPALLDAFNAAGAAPSTPCMLVAVSAGILAIGLARSAMPTPNLQPIWVQRMKVIEAYRSPWPREREDR